MTFRKLSPDDLRQHKGVSFVGVSVAVFVYNDQGKILLLKRGKKARDENGRWAPVAGGLKHGESLDAALSRELKEECRAAPISTDFLGYLDVFRTSDEGLPTHWLCMCFAVKVDPALVEIGEPEATEDLDWFSIEALPTPLHSQFDMFMNKLGDKLKVAVKSKP
jgi:ADP-ribose pyrophosphatase YjhB (NUDIX family)